MNIYCARSTRGSSSRRFSNAFPAVLTPEQIEKLATENVIAIQTKKPEDFHFLDVDVPMIPMNDMLWACLDALHQGTSYQNAGTRLIKNLATLAEEKRTARVTKKETATKED
jgi:hypothetical protein